MKRVASFFAGIGGICYGFKQAGFDVIYANEFDAKACENYRANHPEIELHGEDIKTSDVHIYKQAGNSVVVPVLRRIAENIAKAL